MATQKSTQAAPAASVNICPTKELDRVQIILGEIAVMADSINVLAMRIVAGEDDSIAFACAIRHLSQQMGWAADLGSRAYLKGDAEAWMMPPVYQRAEEVQHG